MSLDLQHLLSQIGKESMAFYVENRLSRLSELANELDLLNWSIPVISVTGTNGKGSTVAALRHIYQASGYRVGVFTSPHLIHFNERIAINDVFIADDEFAHGIEQVIELDKDDELSFFEKIFLVALIYFKQQAVDALILEVGCGGRLDAINILNADLVILSSVDLDHQALLGNTIEAIAKEKAGLFRPNKLAIFADSHCPQSVLETAQSLHVDLKCLAQDYQIIVEESAWTFEYQSYRITFANKPHIHMHAMASAVLTALLLKDKLPISYDALSLANQNTYVPGRLQWIESENPIMLDVAHNPQAASLLVEHLRDKAIKGQIHIVFSAMKDKDCKKIIQIVNKLAPIWYTTQLDSERSHDKQSMCELFEQENGKHQFYEKIEDAFHRARTQVSSEDDYIIVFGSFMLVGHVMSLLQQEGKHVF
jgi:dihydrofolate synthase/folylpolyglutamate synthase